MVTRFNNFDELKSAIETCIVYALYASTQEIYNIIQSKIDEYYAEYKPWKYVRTGDLDNALQKTDPVKKGNYYTCTVGFEDDYLTFQYPGNPSWNKNIPATGADVLYYFNNKSHGGTIKGGHKYWDEAINEINAKYGSIEGLFMDKLSEVSVPIK